MYRIFKRFKDLLDTPLPEDGKFIRWKTPATGGLENADVSSVSGYSGISGYSGVSGYSGFSGISGFSGSSTSGYSGISGYSGVGGESGYSGVSGRSGYSGVGLSGYSGYSGYSNNNHASLNNLTYENAGHTGFQKELVWEEAYNSYLIAR